MAKQATVESAGVGWGKMREVLSRGWVPLPESALLGKMIY